MIPRWISWPKTSMSRSGTGWSLRVLLTLARRGVPHTPADLLEHDCIIYGQSSGGQEWLFRLAAPRHLCTSGCAEIEWGQRSAPSSSLRSGICASLASRWMFAPERSRRMDASSDGSLGHLSLGPVPVNDAKARAFVKWFERTIGQVA